MPKFGRISLLAVLWTVALAALVEACPLAGDINGDCTVQLEDIGLLAEQWLHPSEGCSEPNCADIDGANGVNMSDFAVLADNRHRTEAPLVISEFMASNAKRQPPEEGEPGRKKSLIKCRSLLNLPKLLEEYG